MNESTGSAVEKVEISGHIIDSLLLPKILDCITAMQSSFCILQISIGQHRSDPSYALVEVQADTQERLDEIQAQLLDHGAVPVTATDCRLVEADIAGAFPEGFYSTTNQRTEVRLGGKWIPVDDQEMDCGITVNADADESRCLPMTAVSVGQQIIVGHVGVRVFPEERDTKSATFEFMDSSVSTEKPKRVAARLSASILADARRSGGKTLVVRHVSIFCRLCSVPDQG